MSNEPAASITESDVRVLAAKLKGLHALLSPGEEALLHAVLRRAAARPEGPPEVEGFAWTVSFNPFTYLDAMAGGPLVD